MVKRERKLDRRGRPQYTRKATVTEVARRRDHALRLWRDGYMRRDIAEALDVNVTTVDADLIAMGIRGERRMKALCEGKPTRTLWLDEDVGTPVDPSAHYLNSLALTMIDNSTDYLRRQGVVNLLAHNVHDALRNGDQAWISQARAKLSRASLLFTQLHAVLDSPAAREQGMRETTASDSPPVLRVIEGE